MYDAGPAVPHFVFGVGIDCDYAGSVLEHESDHAPVADHGCPEEGGHGVVLVGCMFAEDRGEEEAETAVCEEEGEEGGGCGEGFDDLEEEFVGEVVERHGGVCACA